MKIYYHAKPVLLEKSGKFFILRLNLIRVETEEGLMWECDEILIKSRSYEGVVAALIHDKYTTDAEFALINNHLTDPDGYADRWNEYQAHRLWAKSYAGETLGLKE